MLLYRRRAENTGLVAASAPELFGYLDDPARLSSHMSKPSWRMGGGRMILEVDEGRGQRLGSHIKLSGRIFGLNLEVETSVTAREPPRRKVWETVDEPKLLVIGRYRMGFESTPSPGGCLLRVFIEYEMPVSGIGRLLGQLLGAWYARWCTRQMFEDAVKHFFDIHRGPTRAS